MFVYNTHHFTCYTIGVFTITYQLLDEVEQNIVICRWRADNLFADAEGSGK
jgi:hypothetical protein